MAALNVPSENAPLRGARPSLTPSVLNNTPVLPKIGSNLVPENTENHISEEMNAPTSDPPVSETHNTNIALGLSRSNTMTKASASVATGIAGKLGQRTAPNSASQLRRVLSFAQTAPQVLDSTVPASNSNSFSPSQTPAPSHVYEPPRDKYGKVVSYAILGDPDEFETQWQQMTPKSNSNKEGVVKSPRQSASKRVRTPPPPEQATRIKHAAAPPNADYYLKKQKDILQTKALEHWQHQSSVWQSVRHLLAKRLNIPMDQLVMHKSETYRLLVEDRALMDEAVRVFERGTVDWRQFLVLGDDLVGLVQPSISTARASLELQRKPDLKEAAAVAPLSFLKSTYMKERQLQMQPWLTQLPIAQMGSVEALHISGNRIKPFTNEKSENMSPSTPALSNNVTASTQPSKESNVSSAKLVLHQPRLSFEARADAVVTQYLVLENTGTAAVHVTWHRLPKQNPLQVQVSTRHPTVFYFYGKTAVIAPGAVWRSAVSFKAKRPGIYDETWALTASPSEALLSGPNQVTLKGTALCDTTRLDATVHRLASQIDRMRALTAARDILSFVFESATHQAPIKTKEIYQSEQEFMKKNGKWGVWYTTQVEVQLTALAEELWQHMGLLQAWDGTIDLLRHVMERVPDRLQRSHFLQRLNDWFKLASQKPVRHPRTKATTTLNGLEGLVYDVLCHLSENVAHLSELLRVQRRLPLDRPQVNKFSSGDDVTGLDEDANANVVATETVSGKKDKEEAGNKRNTRSEAATPSPTKGGANQAAEKNAANAAANAQNAAKDRRQSAPANKNLSVQGTAAAASPAGTKSAAGKKGNAAANAMPAVAEVASTEEENKEPKKEVWTRERHLAEQQYRLAFREQTRILVLQAVQRMQDLCEAQSITWRE